VDPQTHIGCSDAYDACEVGLGAIEERSGGERRGEEKRVEERSGDERNGVEMG
jgi:hypothetical protein